mgnify:CR=1 FL=1
MTSVLGVLSVAWDHAAIQGFSEWAAVVSSSVGGVLIVIGAFVAATFAGLFVGTFFLGFLAVNGHHLLLKALLGHATDPSRPLLRARFGSEAGQGRPRG